LLYSSAFVISLSHKHTHTHTYTHIHTHTHTHTHTNTLDSAQCTLHDVPIFLGSRGRNVKM
jgi:hypothetical protein